MEDAHACILDLTSGGLKNDGHVTDEKTRISFFGVYDGHGGGRVAQYTGENLHNIVAKQDAFSQGNFEQALKDGFLATDRALLSGQYKHQAVFIVAHLTNTARQTRTMQRKFLAALHPWLF